MPLAAFRFVTHPGGWRPHLGVIVVASLVEVGIVAATLLWHRRLAGSVGVLGISLPMLLAAGPVPPIGWLVSLVGAATFVALHSTFALPLDRLSELLVILVWTGCTYAVCTLTGRVRAARDQAIMHLANAEGEERRRIASDLHDDSIQIIVAALLHLDQLAPSPARSQTQRSLRMALDRLRTLAFHLKPPDLETGGLQAALPTLCEAYRPQLAATGCHLTHHIDLDGERYAPLVEELAHRVTLEALQNVLKHAHAQHVAVTASRRPHELRVAVTDDGHGFNPHHRRLGDSPWEHLGLQAKQDRVAWSGGRLRIDSAPGRGTTIHLTLPTRS